MVKRRIWPGARFEMENTGVPLVGWLFNTTTLVRVMLPLLLTLPVKTSRPPGATGLTGQVLVTRMEGAVMAAQEAVALCVTLLPQRLVAMAVRVSIHGPHVSTGTV